VRALKRVVLAVLVLAVSAGWHPSRADEDSRMVIIAAMRRVFTGQDPPLIVRAAAGDANEVEKQRLLKVLTGMANTQPDHGSVESWKAKTSALLAAAQDLVDGKEGAGERLRAASNCRACHQAHRVMGGDR
jgi:mono/diheme cytochrome c family protein